MDYKQKKMTKQQVWDKLHEERKMWMMKCEADAFQATQSTAIRMRQAIDPILAKIVCALFTLENEDGEYGLEIARLEERDGYTWQTRIEPTEEGWRIWAKEVEIKPDEEKEKEA